MGKGMEEEHHPNPTKPKRKKKEELLSITSSVSVCLCEEEEMNIMATATASTSFGLCSNNNFFTFTSRIGVATTGIPRKQQAAVLCSIPRTQHLHDAGSTGRREAMLQPAISAFLYITAPAISSPALALTDDPSQFRLYSDQVNKYNISIPQEWQVGAGETDGFKSITAFYPDGESASNISVVITGLGPDFTRLESFGKVDAFAETLVGGLDRSWQRPPGVAAKLIDSKSANGLYYIEYTLQNPGESRRHIYSAIGMANNGWYNRLYTVTGQCVEEEAEKYSSKIEKAVQSFRLS